jgi:hypothetical protein
MSKANKPTYTDNRGKLGELLKTPATATPIQEVRPVESVEPLPKENLRHINFWVSEQLMERIKIHSARSKKSIRQLGQEAFEQFLDQTI